MSLGGQVTEEDLRRYMIAMGETPMQYQEPYVDQTALAQQAILARPMQQMDQTALAQQAILARPMSQSFMGQPIMSRDVPMASNDYSGLLYPDIRLPAIVVPKYIQSPSFYSDGGGGDGGGFGDSASSAGMGGASQGSAGSTAGTGSSPDGPDGSNASGGGGGGDSKIVCTAMNHQYGFGSFRNAIWLKYSQTNLTKAHEAGYHAIFLPLVDFGFKQGDSRVKLLTRKFLENVARHRSLDLRAKMRGTKRDTLGMIYRSILEPLCYAVGKFKGY